MRTITRPTLFLTFSLSLLLHSFILPSVEAQQGRPTTGQKVLTNSIGMKFVSIPPGEFTMGSNDGDDDEKPPHQVWITRPFYLGIHEVTRGQFAEFVRDQNYRTEAEQDGKGGYGIDDEGKHSQKPEYTWRNPGFRQTDEHPVVNVSWNDAVAFCEWLSRKEERTYRLPTEAEWEYACRAGTTTVYQHGDDPEGQALVGNVADGTLKAKFRHWKRKTINARDDYVFTAPVGKFRANNFGLHDMHGNVWEWCADWYDPKYYANSASADPTGPSSGWLRVGRGGGWDGGCQSASRRRIMPSTKYSFLGFRVALSPSGD